MEMQQKRGFKTGFTKEIKPSDPESLFRDLKRAPDIQHIWSHQADLLRAYDKEHLNTPDIALQLPTGTGKTLIGLLLAEYRRRKYNERVIYLSPTRQLVRQVVQHSKRYGIHAYALLAPDYSNINDYRLANAVGITTYSSLFNINPRIDDAQIIILDDAHSSEDYIGSLWSVSVSRRKRGQLYGELVELLRPEMDEAFVESVLDDDGTSLSSLEGVDMIPFPRFWKHVSAIRDLLDARLPNKPEWYPWSMIRGSLHACCLYVSWDEILIRPIIPPAMTHRPFANAKQRIYMSATLGESGELERITGVRHIERLPIPEGWDKQSSGRRLFLFPNMSMDDDNAKQATVDVVKQIGKALILTPRSSDFFAIEERFSEQGVTVLGTQDIEDSLDSFVDRDDVVLVLANRYDGIDLPGKSCRLLIIEGLPAGTNLQERFLWLKAVATPLLKDRLRTRFTQGVGRCCRHSTDYAGVLVVGQKVLDFCARREDRAGMHPELQAEIEFGIKNSSDLNTEGISELLQLFLSQGDEWAIPDAEIISLRESTNKEKNPIADQLMKVVPYEVSYIYELWKKDYIAALGRAVEVTDMLSGEETIGYKAWWYYLAGCAAWLGSREQSIQDLTLKAKELFARAAKSSKFISWFAEIARDLEGTSHHLLVDADVVHACEVIFAAITNLGFTGQKFNKEMNRLLDSIKLDDSSSFEAGTQMLGNYLGFESSKPQGDGAPDAVWCFSNRIAIVFEAKSEELPSNPVSINTVRQALTHAQWARNHRQMVPNAEIIVLVITPRSSITEDAKRNAQGLWHLSPEEMRTLAESLVSALRRVRSRINGNDQITGTQVIYDELRGLNLLLPELVAKLKVRSLASLPVG